MAQIVSFLYFLLKMGKGSMMCCCVREMYRARAALHHCQGGTALVLEHIYIISRKLLPLDSTVSPHFQVRHLLLATHDNLGIHLRITPQGTALSSGSTPIGLFGRCENYSM